MAAYDIETLQPMDIGNVHKCNATDWGMYYAKGIENVEPDFDRARITNTFEENKF